jgi:predicted SAM-dependent methyltransferase
VSYSRNSTGDRETSVNRLNWGCGSHVAAGWINSDIKDGPGIDLVADIRNGLPLADASMDYVVSIHALPEFGYYDLQPVLEELRRVLKVGGVIRLALPDVRRGIDAYLRGDDEYFKVDPEEVKSPGGRFIVHMLWYGYSRSLFTPDFAEELLEESGFIEIRECAYQETTSDFEQIVDLDNRADESFYIEASRGHDPSQSSVASYNSDLTEELKLQIVELTHSTPNDQLRGHFRVEQEGTTLQLIGWVLGLGPAVVGVEVLADTEVVAGTSPVIERPDIAEAFPDVSGADTCGFQLAMEPSGKGRSQLELRATLEDGEHAPIGQLEVTTSRGRRKGLFRRFG